MNEQLDKYVVVSTNNNPDYLFFAPYIEYAWNQLGWKLCIIITNDVEKADLKTANPSTKIIRIQEIQKIRTETISQAGRLYAANYFKQSELANTLLMTSDMDLLPLSDYWRPAINNITVYGHDLTWYSTYPMGYVAMSAQSWKKLFELSGDTELDLLRDAEKTGLPFKHDWDSWWGHDQVFLTERLNTIKNDLVLINRGQIDIAGATLAKGRIDRYNWAQTQIQPEPFIDAHCHNNNVTHPDKLKDFLTVFNKFYPNYKQK